jgi:hypothetical protein
VRIPIAIWAGGLVVSSALGAGVVWIKEHDARIRAEERVSIITQRADSLGIVVDSFHSAIAIADSMHHAEKKAAEVKVARLSAAAEFVKRNNDAAIIELKKELTNSQQEALDSIVSGFNRQLALRDTMMAAQARLVESAEHHAELYRQAFDASERHAAELQLIVDNLNKVQHHSTVHKVISGTIKFVGIAGLVFLAAK